MELKVSSTNKYLTALAVSILFLSSSALSCTKAQMIDYDYQIKEVLGKGYSTFGRLWLLDDQESCVKSLKYGACLSVSPLGKHANLTIKIAKETGTFSIHEYTIKYNTDEIIRFNTMSMDVYLKLYISNTIADIKMSGRSCNNGFPKLPRQITRKEIDNMFRH